jgi:hypothetical protein
VDAERVGLISDVAEAYRHLKPDGSWSTEALPVIELYDLMNLPVGGNVVKGERRQLTVLFCDLADTVRVGRQ